VGIIKMANYNLTGVEQANGYYELFIATNNLTATKGLYASLVMISIWLVLMLVLHGFGLPRALFASSLTVSLISIFFLFLGLIGWTIAIFPMVICLVSILILLWSE